MAAKKPSAAMAFVIDALKKKRDASYGEIVEAAKKRRIKLYPIIYGRAQALLGIVKSAPRGSGKAKVAKAARAARMQGAVRRGPGRPRKIPAGAVDTSSLEGVIRAVKTLQNERERLRSSLSRIQGILQDVL